MKLSHGSAKKGRRIAGLVVLALLATACYRPAAVQHQTMNPTTRPWWCHSTGGEGTHGSQYYMDLGITKGMLSWDDCLNVSGNMDKALAFAMQWPTRGVAEAAGWRPSVNYAMGMGTHHARGNPLGGAVFNPDQPNFLQYDGNGPDAKLVGMSWFVDNGPDTPPSGFAGNNDWWHVHEYLCISASSGLVIFDGKCPAGVAGASVYLGNMWLLHAWIVPNFINQSDVFIGHHPCLKADGPAPKHDPCWTSGGTPHT